MDNLAALQKVAVESKRIVAGITPDQLGDPTPCEGWAVRDILNHVAGGATIFAISAEEGAVPDDKMAQLTGGDNLGDDYKGAFSSAVDRAVAAFEIPGVMEKVVKLPFGEMPAGVALNIAVVDVATHACDLAKATGQTITDTAMLEAVLAMGKDVIRPELRMPGVFGAEQECPADAPLSDRLLAFAGRKI